jgi:PIN domain nuclease of toxin-antitoxin system
MTLAPQRLSPYARSVVEAGDHELFLSAASAWEIAIKHALGKVRLPETPVKYVPSRSERLGVRSLPIDQGHALHVATLPPHHADPFDRLLIAQAQIEDLPILTADPILGAYDVKIIAAT